MSWFRVLGWGLVVALLITPAIAMRFTDEVQWTAFDFVVAAVLLGGSGLLIEVGAKLSTNTAFRVGMTIAVINCLLIIWLNLAVGIIGNEDNPANFMYLSVLGLVAVGTVFLRAKTNAMSWLMIATAITQLSISIAAVLLKLPTDLQPAFFLNSAFAILWLIAAGLFKVAGGRYDEVKPATQNEA
ncbi:MAG: hypothetical protein LAT77_02490 [Aliidiomarina sp.]|uniref:hypothetical protein n=1 Tax=Aliidiomarina sp. TaxID=1872439 RepID=UPI0025BD1A05|nr:hypothetical protein [Aliidiomarina sp.]MCH8500760.1 hypothetical protein [Aliidiomarina sp.]